MVWNGKRFDFLSWIHFSWICFIQSHPHTEIVKEWFVIQDSWKIQKTERNCGDQTSRKRKRLYSLLLLWFRRRKKTCQSDKEKQWIREMGRESLCMSRCQTSLSFSIRCLSFRCLLLFPVSMIKQATCEKIHVFIRRIFLPLLLGYQNSGRKCCSEKMFCWCLISSASLSLLRVQTHSTS